MNAAGGDLQRVTDTPLHSGAAAWSPDGTRVAFKEGVRGGAYDLFTICPDGSDRRQVSGNAYEDRGAEWSPDGRQLVYLSNGTGDKEIYIIDADGAGLRRLTHHSATDCAPAWHPDGSRILFSSCRGTGKDLYVMATDGSRVRQLTDDTCGSGHADWSPDGRRICYRYRGRGVSELRVMNADGSGKKAIVGAPYTVCCTAWIVRHSKRVLVGSPEADAGYDPPLGDKVQAVVVVHDGRSLRSVIGITSGNGSPVRIVRATEIGELDVRSEDPVRIAESIWIGQPSTEHVPHRDSVRRCRLSFDPRTGRLGRCVSRRAARAGVDA
jgi:WD40 repeat protein